MPIIERYILRRIAMVTVAALAVTTGMALTTQVLNRVDFLTSTGQSAVTFLQLAAYLVPSMVVVVMPFALLVGVLQTLRAMNQNAELAVLEASGSGIVSRARPAMLLALGAAALVAFLATVVEPAASRAIRELVARASGDLLSAAVQSGEFKRIGDGLVLQIAEKRAGGEFGGIFVHDARDTENHITYIADSGALVTQDDKLLMVVRNGEIQRKNIRDNSISFIRFDAYSLDAATFSAPTRAGLRAKDRPTAYLLDPDPDDPFFQSSPASFMEEFHRRLSEPLYSIAFVMVGLFFTVNARSSRQESGLALMQAAMACFALRAAGFTVASDAGTSTAMAAAAYALPLSAILLAGWMLATGRRPNTSTRLLDLAAARTTQLAERVTRRGRPA
ncbi:MAG: LptF/LptG family permease [Rhizobiaceae bacterium]|nr:LptF/LptG family permease [Rhizobiaceae bacterium]